MRSPLTRSFRGRSRVTGGPRRRIGAGFRNWTDRKPALLPTISANLQHRSADEDPMNDEIANNRSVSLASHAA
jgi:hypothetical protein